MTQKVLLTLLTGSMILFSGCATIIDGKTQKINLMASKPTQVEINGASYTAPNIVILPKSKEDGILVIKECDKKILLKKTIVTTFWMNILSGGAFGSSTDYGTDSMWKYDQDNINVDCK